MSGNIGPRVLAAGLALALAGCSTEEPTVLFETSRGDIRIELFSLEAPVSTENFLGYVDSGYYDGLIFHRVVPGFVVQAGGHEPDMTERVPAAEPIVNESANGLANLRGTLSMARLADPHSARSQFFINLVDNAGLNHGAAADDWGYAVFGRVIEGMDVVDDMAARPTGAAGMHRDVPLEPVVIISARRAGTFRD